MSFTKYFSSGKHIVVVAVFILGAGFCRGFEPVKNKWNDFQGKLGKSNIQLSLFLFPDGEIKGNYCYAKYGTKIQLHGQLSGNRIELAEFSGERPNAFFSGKVFTDSLDKFEGTWTDSAGISSQEFRLSLTSVCGGTYEHRYEGLHGTDDDVEHFMQKAVSSILSDDREWVADHISYPVRVSLGKNNKTITVKHRKQLLNYYDRIFHPDFKAEIRLFCISNLFVNYQGVMLGNGQLWIHNMPGASESGQKYRIIAVNN